MGPTTALHDAQNSGRVSGEMVSDLGSPGSSGQSLTNIQDMRDSDTAVRSNVAMNGVESFATEGAYERADLGNLFSSFRVQPSGSESSVPDRPKLANGTSEDSLNVLEEKHRDFDLTEACKTAPDVALPESNASSSSAHDISTAAEAFEDTCKSEYLRRIRRLQGYMPHLNNTSRDSRAHHRAGLQSFDYSGGKLVSENTHMLQPNTHSAKKDFARAMIDDVPAKVDYRLLVVNDLSDTLVHILGTCLGITPEFFEEHIVNSGWHDSSYHDRDPEQWNTQDLVKNYTSIRWHRPIDRRVPLPWAPYRLLDPLSTPDTGQEQLSQTKRIIHRTEPLVNIIRRPWEARLEFGGFSAWEERATVWGTKIGNCHLGVWDLRNLKP